MSAVRLIRRIPWLDNLLSTQVSFALGALSVFIPMFSALVSMAMRARHAESFNKSTHQPIVFEMAADGIPVPNEER